MSQAINKPTSKAAKVAQVEEWDSDESSAVPGTIVQAREQAAQPSSRPSRAAESRRRRDAPSDSGYSSQASAPPVIQPPSQGPAQRPATVSPTKANKSKPVIHRIDSARDERRQAISSGAGRQKKQCDDPYCRDPNCVPTTRYERRSTMSHQQPSAPAYAPQHYAHYSNPAMPPPVLPASAMMPPPPRPRAQSTSRTARPVSIHGYSGLSYSGAPSGPPPSQSAYYGYPQQYPSSPSAGYYGSTPPTQTLDYAQASAYVPPSPTSPNVATYPGYPGYSGGMSARAINPGVAGLEMPTAMQPNLGRTMSARRPSERRDSRIPEPESASDSESTSESSESSPEREHRQRRQSSRRGSRAREEAVAVVHHPRRPSVSRKYNTEASIPTTARVRRESSRPREHLRRAPRSDTFYEYPSSSEVNDSDQTQRAVVYRRGAGSSSQSSRRPSVSTTASSGRTKNTSLSSNTDYSRDYSRVILEGPNGRRVAYLSKNQQAQLTRQSQQQDDYKYEKQRLQEERVAAYQREMGGGEPQELTAENIKKSQYRKSASHVSGRSQKSSGSGSKASKSNGIQIQSGDTVLHVYGDAKVEMRQPEDGGPPQFFIASSSGRDSAYHTTSSKSSGSRMGRSRARDDSYKREKIIENEYEEGY